MSGKSVEDSLEPVVVWDASNQMEAQIVAGRLRSEGIPAMIQGESAGTVFGLSTGNLAEAKVLVPAPLAERALEILESDVDWDETPNDGIMDETGDWDGDTDEDGDVDATE